VPTASVKLSSYYKDWSATTDDEGGFTIKGVRPGEGQLVVEAKSYGREQVHVDDIARETEMKVELKPERIVHVKVVDDRGEPIAGATVEAYDKPRDDFRTAVTGEDGTVSMSGIHFDTDTLALRLTQEDHVSPGTFGHDISLPADKTESTHQVSMPRAGRITGKVTDAQSGKPLNGARVMTGEGRSDVSPRDWANYLGQYTITSVQPDPATVTVHLSGFAPELETVEVKAGEAAMLDFKLRPGATLTGVVKNKSGEFVVGAYVDATRWRGHATLGLRAITGADGRFVIDSAPHDEFEIMAYARYGEEVILTVTANEEEPIEITLPDAPAAPELRTSTAVKAGDQAPAVAVTTLKGERLELEKLEGKTVLLDFWATWCVPCVAELPIFVDLYDQGKTRKDFVMIGVNLDGDEKMLRRFLKKHRVEWHQVHGPKGGARETAERFGVIGLPAVFLIGPDGRILASDLREDEIAKAVKKVWEKT
jgi:thiol-disulfide isomerase/thioredoxin